MIDHSTRLAAYNAERFTAQMPLTNLLPPRRIIKRARLGDCRIRSRLARELLRIVERCMDLAVSAPRWNDSRASMVSTRNIESLWHD